MSRACRRCNHPPTPRHPGLTRSLRLGLIVYVQYGLLALDIRFVADRKYLGIVVVNALIALTGWYVTRGVAEARTSTERLCLVLGGTTGALTAVWLS